MTDKNSTTAVTAALAKVLADSYTLYLKTQNYHWNVTGPHFSSLHALFQTQYEDLIAANDEIAERIRALGAKAPGSFAAFEKISTIKGEEGTPGWQDMVKNLANDQDKIVATAKEALKSAEEVDDQPTIDLMVGRIAQHEKNKWMLKSHLE